MGKSFIKLIFILGCYSVVFGQDSLCVFKTKGIVLMDFLHQKKPITKGDFILRNSKVSVLAKSEITVIDAKGSVYFIDKTGDYQFKDILKHQKKTQDSNLTSGYFKYIWSELLGEKANKAIIAGVYRGTILMKFPKDSSKIYNSKITFKWDLIDNEKLYAFFIKNEITAEILKIESNGSQLSLFEDHPIFVDGNSFSWAVSKDAFPNLKNITFNHFTLINRETYEVNKLTFDDFIADLKQIGTSDAEIETILCERFLLCK